MTIGSLSGSSSTNDPLIGNRIEENSSVGIVIQGEDSFNNVILSNQIDTNIYFGIQFVQGATTVAVPRLTSVTTSQVTGVIRGEAGGRRIMPFKNSAIWHFTGEKHRKKAFLTLSSTTRLTRVESKSGT